MKMSDLIVTVAFPCIDSMIVYEGFHGKVKARQMQLFLWATVTFSPHETLHIL